MARNRRSDVRATAVLDVLMSDDDTIENVSFFTQITNVSVHGLQCTSDAELSADRVMSLNVTLHEDTFRLVGTLKWCAPYETDPGFSCGILIDPEESEDFQIWSQFLETFVLEPDEDSES